VGRSVLVVDDSPTLRKVVATILERNQFSVLTAADGVDALQKLDEYEIDLVLLDFVMPRMNGYQCCREIRANPRYDQLPVVLMSAKGEKMRGQFVTQTGAVDAITKPFDARALVAVIENALARGARDSNRFSAVVTEPDEDDANDVQTPGALGSLFEKTLTPNRLFKLATLLNSLEGGDEQAVMSGDLSFISIAEVLQMLELQRQSGMLVISRPEAEIQVYLSEGKLDLVQGRGLPVGFRLGRYLIEDGVIEREALRGILEHPTSGKRLLGEILVGQSQATAEQIQRALKRQTCELIYELVRWEKGRFAFFEGAISPESTMAELGLAAGALLMEGFRRVDEWRRIEGSIDFDEILFQDTAVIERAGRDKLTAQESSILDAIDGERTVRQIVDHVPANTFDVCRILYQLMSSRLVRRKAA
jgi:DNA-binding response OmpR family regulator